MSILVLVRQGNGQSNGAELFTFKVNVISDQVKPSLDAGPFVFEG
jgi:hypothetical protein